MYSGEPNPQGVQVGTYDPQGAPQPYQQPVYQYSPNQYPQGQQPIYQPRMGYQQPMYQQQPIYQGNNMYMNADPNGSIRPRPNGLVSHCKESFCKAKI